MQAMKRLHRSVLNLLQAAPDPLHTRRHGEAQVLLPLGSRRTVQPGSSAGPTIWHLGWRRVVAHLTPGGLCCGACALHCISCAAVVGISLYSPALISLYTPALHPHARRRVDTNCLWHSDTLKAFPSWWHLLSFLNSPASPTRKENLKKKKN